MQLAKDDDHDDDQLIIDCCSPTLKEKFNFHLCRVSSVEQEEEAEEQETIAHFDDSFASPADASRINRFTFNANQNNHNNDGRSAT